MRFLIDAQLPPSLAGRLESLGHGAEHVNAIGLGQATDRQIWDHAAQQGAVLVSKDGTSPRWRRGQAQDRR